ncbi:hypothetical protein SCD_n00312 [Sulfuricella denitrificans skB26]|uniref:Uncharacterized protein n=1 Tax=Sulfuricella denitrificans (strain DSM 22764 / NBRC 105220 / skB26) TaxID=1163617 RepID=S6AEG0_SULDS|nr:DUF484 family protein [Sulfuricella denitrificans]BAN34161.1 hypothetical protein SCD_n00312 [Sulfuricella denitrificans skB26]
MNSEAVAQYLHENPEFFEQHSALLAEVFIPHPHGGRAISIAERQQLAMRDKNRLLETKLRELIQFGEENDAISEKMHRLSLSLLGARDLDSALNTAYFNLREDFDVPHVAIRIWAGADLPARPEFMGATIEMCAFADELITPKCGPQLLEEAPSWFGEAGPNLRSFAYVAMRSEQSFGLLALASEDVQRFYPEMGTLYLKRLGELVSAALLRYLKA